MKNLKRNVKGITLITLVISIIVLLILAGVSISMLTGENGLFSIAKLAVNEFNKKSEQEQEKLNEMNKYFDNTEKTEKPQLPEVDTTATLKYIGTSMENNRELEENPMDNVIIPTYIDKDPNRFNDIFTINNYKLQEPYVYSNEFNTDIIAQGYIADVNNRTRQMTWEFNISCQKFEIFGESSFRVSVWDDSINKWKYIGPSTGVPDDYSGLTLITFPDEKDRTIKIDTYQVFYRASCQKG